MFDLSKAWKKCEACNGGGRIGARPQRKIATGTLVSSSGAECSECAGSGGKPTAAGQKFIRSKEGKEVLAFIKLMIANGHIEAIPQPARRVVVTIAKG
jgi:hypothetical protein